jgi:superfamily I DNA/RNA helicase
MNLSKILSNFVYKNLTKLSDGTTLEDVEKELQGLDTELAGLSDTEKAKMFEETAPLKSYLDSRVSKAIDKNKTELQSEAETEKQKLQSKIEELQAKVPTDDLDGLKKAWLEASDKDKPAKKREYEFAKMQADLETLRKEKQEADNRAKKSSLLEVARKQLGDRKLPPFVKLDNYLGDDEAETIERVNQMAKQHDEYLKGLTAQKTEPNQPPDSGDDSGFDLETAMKGAGNF